MATQLEFIALLPADADVTAALCSPDTVFYDKSAAVRGGFVFIESAQDQLSIRVRPYQAIHGGQAMELQVSCNDKEKLEYMRFWISDTLRTVLKAEHLYLTHDGITAFYAAMIYPTIHRIENRLRRFLIRFFLQVVGVNWLESTAKPSVYTKAMDRRERGLDKWTKLINHEISYMDFHELGDLITKQSTGFNDPASLSDRIRGVATLEELEALKADMESNYTKYFQDTFQSKRFHKHWNDLSHIRVRVAHNALLTLSDSQKTETAVEAVERILDQAEARMTMVELSEREQVRVTPAEEPSEETAPTEDDYSDLLPRLTILGKVDLPVGAKDTSTRRDAAEADEEFLIEPFEFLEALDEYRRNPHFDRSRFLALSTFLNILEDEGYNRASCSRMAYQLAQEGKIEIYEYTEPFWLKSVKAVRMV